jgi:hypothetical protein
VNYNPIQMPLVIAPSILETFALLYSDSVIIDDIIEYYHIQSQVTKFLFDHYQFQLQEDTHLIVSYCTTPSSLLKIQCQHPNIEIQIDIDGQTGQLQILRFDSYSNAIANQICKFIGSIQLNVNLK